MSVNLGSAEEMSIGIMRTLDALSAGNYEKTYYTPTMAVDRTNVAEYIKR
jgi:hypothetical protein